ncbi:hypothetical protein Pla110_07140 [Polystyrenella longa]|uniref:3-keto-alpha-glucoside-1,2-lyase/3-keto-2-hydroxy-glucal hydratase domain-containing protein n=1 Tax=Polystyrenella longa TaxID=2528007 RepID=A0A518CIG7_9PLAN|nr:DUF1080 domain-containing protein [Polystyrenella longa]QDU79010.1 hypothetical protein Pla110_07140 [Polystyrenella longa]
MKKMVTLSLILLATLCTTSLMAEEKLNTPPEGFTALFNGKDLENWRGLVGNGNPYTLQEMSEEDRSKAQAEANELMSAHWGVQDGVLVFDGKGKSICSAKDFGDFELYVDWKIEPKGDSGIYVRSTPQIQIWDTEYPEYFKHGAEKGSGSLWNNKDNERFPLAKADNPVGEWNTFHIKMVGEKVTIWLNGKLVTDNVILENYWKRDAGIPVIEKGAIELQNHGNTLYFRNIYVKELN